MNLYNLKFVVVALVSFVFTNCLGKISSRDSIITAFKSIEKNPTVISFNNNWEINNSGGHLQGVQLFQNDGIDYVILSGSSDSYSYYSVVKLGAKNAVISVNRLMDKPFKHAGGFQVFQNYMAVGIEDNSAKGKAKVCIYNISNIENSPVNPISIIKREGEPMRSSAGCVGLTKYKNQALVVVGDWDTKHIDFYSCEFKNLTMDNFEMIFSIDAEKVSKEGWINNSWLPYQNINLFTFANNELYFVGLGQNNSKENIADLYRLTEDNSGKFSLIKIATESLNCGNETSFRNGAGVELCGNGELKIISCGYHIDSTSYLNYFNQSKK